MKSPAQAGLFVSCSHGPMGRPRKETQSSDENARTATRLRQKPVRLGPSARRAGAWLQNKVFVIHNPHFARRKRTTKCAIFLKNLRDFYREISYHRRLDLLIT